LLYIHSAIIHYVCGYPTMLLTYVPLRGDY